jgi:hypothetical protein
MPRQSFLSRESFIKASAPRARETLLSLPFHLDHISYVTENRVIDSMRFYYRHPTKKREYYVDVSVLPLDDQFTRLSLHGMHINGQVFHEDAQMALALQDFESAIHASISGDLVYYKNQISAKGKAGKKLLVSLFKSLIPSASLHKKSLS